MKTIGNDTHQNCFDKKNINMASWMTFFLRLLWFSYSECLTGKGLCVESRCVQVGARQLPVVSPVRADYQAALIPLPGYKRHRHRARAPYSHWFVRVDCGITAMAWSYLKAWGDANRSKHVCICPDVGNIIPGQASTEDHRWRIGILLKVLHENHRAERLKSLDQMTHHQCDLL